jgi:SAM-dependent methyltransferase
MKNNDLLTEQKFWEDYWNNKRDELIINVEDKGYFQQELDKIISDSNIKSVLELGGFPGTYSVYLKKKYNLDTSVLDYYINQQIVNELLEVNNLQKNSIDLIEDDLTLNHEIIKIYDFVFSLGLIEHFIDTKQIVKRHLDFLKPGGELMILIPNFRGINGWLQRKFDRANYDVHYIECMDLDYLRTIASDLKIQNRSVYYTGRFSVWLGNMKTQSPFVKFFVKCLLVTGKLATKIIPVESKLFSPFIVLKGRKSDN